MGGVLNSAISGALCRANNRVMHGGVRAAKIRKFCKLRSDERVKECRTRRNDVRGLIFWEET